jgi:hypothetical protein
MWESALAALKSHKSNLSSRIATGNTTEKGGFFTEA